MSVMDMLLEIHKVELSAASKKKLEESLIRREYRKDELIIDLGQRCTALYIVEHGLLRQFYYKDGREVSEHFSSEGDLAFCVESLFLKEPASLLMQALEASVVYLLDYEKFQGLCDACSDINRFYRAVFERDLIITQRKADSWRFLSSKERYDRFCAEYPQAALRAPLSYIASYLLMSPETLSRIRSAAAC